MLRGDEGVAQPGSNLSLPSTAKMSLPQLKKQLLSGSEHQHPHLSPCLLPSPRTRRLVPGLAQMGKKCWD